MFTATARKNSANAAIDRAVRQAFDSIEASQPDTRAAFERLLLQVRRSSLLRHATEGGRSGGKDYGTIVAGLLSLATYHQEWIRPIGAWEPTGVNPMPQLSSLAGHLLAEYPVPAFLTSVWLEGQTHEARQHQHWFHHVGVGRNIRTADLPLPYTKRMAHHFLQAPDHLTVKQALRWGQFRGLGGSKGLALAAVSTRLGQTFESEDFWGTVVHFFVNHPELDSAQIGPVIDYLYHQKYVPEEVAIEGGALVDLGPPQPDLAMKGRTPRSLLRQVNDWKNRPTFARKFSSRRKLELAKWEPSGIEPFRQVGQDSPAGSRCWTIRELTSGQELIQEGAAMHHCVASYRRACASRKTSIWSMRFENEGRQFRVMTIEVNLTTRTICQASRRFNTPPNEKALGVMKQWAEQARLSIEYWSQGMLVCG